jgi:hypothetical protein
LLFWLHSNPGRARKSYSRKAILIILELIATIVSANTILPWNTIALAQVAPKYTKPADYDGHYSSKSISNDPNDFTRLVLSHDGRSLDPPDNDHDAPTKPGFYPSYYGPVFSFESVRISGKKIVFKTRKLVQTSYSFEGNLGEETDPDFDVPLRLIEGTLTKLENGRIVEKRKVSFGIVRIY